MLELSVLQDLLNNFGMDARSFMAGFVTMALSGTIGALIVEAIRRTTY